MDAVIAVIRVPAKGCDRPMGGFRVPVHENRDARAIVRAIEREHGQVQPLRERRNEQIRLDAAPGECFPDCLTSSGVNVSLHARGSGRRSGERSPVIEHLRHVLNAVREFRHAKQQVVILRAFEAGPVAAGHFEDRSSNHREVVHVVITQQQFRRPIRLELRVVAVPRRVDLVFIRVEQVGVRMRLQSLGHCEECVRCEGVVVIE